MWVTDLGASPGHKPIIDQSCGALLFCLQLELIEIYPPATFLAPYNGSKTQLCPKKWPT